MEKHKWYRRRGDGLRKTTEPYDIDFKRQLVAEYINSKKSTHRLAREYGIPRETLYNWVKFSEKNADNIIPIVELDLPMKKKPTRNRLEDSSKLALEESQLKIEALELLIDQAEQQYKISIRKKSASKQSKK